MERRRILVIAGSDSSGGAGLEADQKVIAHHQCYAMTATTALTAQNTQGVRDIHYIPPDFVIKQIDAIFDDIGVDIVKMGMLASAETVSAVATALDHHGNPLLVLDPVMVATSGAQLLPNKAVRNIREKLLPLTTILTPNIPEAKLLLQNTGVASSEICSVDDLVDVARQIQALGPTYVLLKGGHLPITKGGTISNREPDRDLIINVLHDGKRALLFESDYIASKNTHGTGCSLASIACRMACDPSGDIAELVKSACRYIEVGIRTSIGISLGKGSGPINHFHQDEKLAGLRVKLYVKK